MGDLTRVNFDCSCFLVLLFLLQEPIFNILHNTQSNFGQNII